MKKSIGLDIPAPAKTCDDDKCAWHGSLSVRGKVFRGIVQSAKSQHTVIVEWGYHRHIPKYERYEKRKSRVSAHNPECIRAREGDTVTIAECRQLSKTKNFIVVEKKETITSKKIRK